jgi:hypothetical protein
MREDALRQVGRWIVTVLNDPVNHPLALGVRDEVRNFLQDYPVSADAVRVEAP